MRRVLLLVCLIVSLVELDWERQRIYLLSSAASLLLVRVPTEKAFKTAQGLPSEVYATASPDNDNQAEVRSGRTQADHPERSRMLDCV